MDKVVFKVDLRDSAKKNKQLREEGIIPANVYGPGKKSQAIQAKTLAFEKLSDKVGETGLVYLQIADKKQIPVLIDDVQLSPVKGRLIHVVFKQVDLKDKLKAEVPVELVGEFEVKDAVLVTVRDSIEVEALPTDLPEKFEINVEKLSEIGQSVTLADLEYDKEKVEIVIGEEGMEAPVVLVQEVKEEEEEPVEVEEELEGEGEETDKEAKAETEEPSAEKTEEKATEKEAVEEKKEGK
ncbi:MAG: 50S ribosomal protein L25 [Candidatus Woesebacteria bacterium]|jgi:large subunit ribosomal protein L25